MTDFLIPVSELLAAHARYEQAKAAPAPPPPPAPPTAPYEYRPRTQAQWERRIEQTWQSNRTFRPRPAPVTLTVEDPEIETDGDESDTGEPKSKVSSTTPCITCGHPRKDHHCAPEAHVADGDHDFYCLTAHCNVMRYENGQHVNCDCQHFRATETDVPKLTRARVGPYDRCANPACGHWKIDHCTKHKPGAASRLKAGELPYRILQKPDGGAYGCRHFDPENPACQCDSAGCSATPDGQNFCKCLAFQNPWLVRKTRVATQKRGPRKAVAASLASTMTTSTPESVPRKSRKKKTAFVTGQQEIFPPGETSVTP